MALMPTVIELLARARVDLRMGLPVVLRGKTSAALAIATETTTATRLKDMRALGPLTITLTARRAQTLKARIYDEGLARIPVPDHADLRWVEALANPANDLERPMKGPLNSLRGGNIELNTLAIELVKSARLLPSALMVDLDAAAEFAATYGLTTISHVAAEPLLQQSSPLHRVAAARLPIEAAEAGRLHIFRPEDGNEEHYAIEIGRPDRSQPVLARLHSACFTGDVLGSLKCDCGPQLRGALAQMGEIGAGVLLYLNQEGRGIGLANKMRAYSLQDQGFDTVEANHRLGFEDDERDFRLGASILRDMGFSAVRLLTNNPNKIAMMENTGIKVAERVALKVGENPFNQHYLATKAAKSGHML
ncbi:GTP cyclohydrolase II [Epibacterium ulvae]|uniref:GTP cyclohydrolase II n=1 Tax=Epibacterium ulvae TaxID=1156985 RepID=UPI00249088BA|nr:GTP cyclohydrolase II [Epibacterium ulvae]